MLEEMKNSQYVLLVKQAKEFSRYFLNVSAEIDSTFSISVESYVEVSSNAAKTIEIEQTGEVQITTPNASLCVVTPSADAQNALQFSVNPVLRFTSGDDVFYSCVQQVNNELITLKQSTGSAISATLMAGDDYFGM